MARYDVQVMNFSCKDGSWWLAGIDYRDGRNDCFEAVTVSPDTKDEVARDMLSVNKCVLRVQYGNEKDPMFIGGKTVSSCIRKALGETCLSLRNKKLGYCIPERCRGNKPAPYDKREDLFRIKKVEGGALFECTFMQDSDDRYVFVPEESQNGSRLFWAWKGSVTGYAYRFGWYYEKATGCNVLYLSSGDCDGENVGNDVRLVMEEQGAVCREEGTVLPYITLKDAPAGQVYDYQIFGKRLIQDPFGDSGIILNMIDYTRGVCKSIKLDGFESDEDRSAYVRGKGIKTGRCTEEVIESLLGHVNLSRGDGVLPGIPHNKFNGARSDAFEFITAKGGDLLIIGCNLLGNRKDKYISFKRDWLRYYWDGELTSEWTADFSIPWHSNGEQSYGYAKTPKGVWQLFLLIAGVLNKKINFCDDHAELRNQYGFLEARCEYVTLADAMFGDGTAKAVFD